MTLRQRARAAAKRRFPEDSVVDAIALRYGFAIGMLYGWRLAVRRGKRRPR